MVNVDELDSHNRTSLSYAVTNQYSAQVIQMLIRDGDANPLIGDQTSGDSVMHLAVRDNNTVMVKHVLNACTSDEMRHKLVNVANKSGCTPLHVAVSTWESGTFANGGHY